MLLIFNLQMKCNNLNEMVKGWFVGHFSPAVLQTDQFEVAVKIYKAGETEGLHVHKIATEITVVLHGEVEMCGKILKHGDIITVEPNEPCEFRAITDVTTVVVKMPSISNDKYILDR